ncbi:MAG: type II toxin-antitoxin system VapB family antitoxin [Euzebyaceae bacterium]|jgi:plasmid stability protein|nr:type II toxin-antitoxin system VapB family antitoxin [Euzebyaceae bacterium]MBA3620284.1 type II toxin-antitoxin system VapB family antitoxin [Acidothermales bacterium]
MKTTLNLDDELLRRAKLRAAAKGTTLTALVEEGLRTVLVEPSRRQPAELNFPIFRGEGPTAVDPADRAALYDLMEDRGPSSI